jgi:hypothetical protein
MRNFGDRYSCINPNCVAGSTVKYILQDSSGKEVTVSQIFGKDSGHCIYHPGEMAKSFSEHPWLGYVKKIDDKSYRIFCEPSWMNSGILVSEEVYPKFYSLVPKFLEQHPEMLFTDYSDTTYKRRSLERQIKDLKQYLSDTDYTVVKCSEEGTSMEEQYPDEYEFRNLVRGQINELETEVAKEPELDFVL